MLFIHNNNNMTPPPRKDNSLNSITSSLSQHGRSMLEMLAVLAIMGILTIGGIAGYTFAISKHRANQIYDQVDLRATTSFSNPFVRQTAEGATYALAGFDEVVENITYQHKKTAGNGYDIIAAHVPERVCKRLQDMSFPVPKSVTLNEADLSSTCGNDNTFVFSYDGLSVGKPSSGVDPIDCNCSGCQSCESGTCQDNDNLCGPKEVCVAGSCQCAPGYTECQGNCYTTCQEGFMRDPATCDCVCEPQECPENATWNSETCSCECIEGYDMCNNTCHPQCSGSGMTGSRDPDTCACTCIEGTNADTCACPTGHVYVDGQCQKFECKGGTIGQYNYSCEINGLLCGQYCDSLGEQCYFGFCRPELCPNGSKFVFGHGYYGCEIENRYCYLRVEGNYDISNFSYSNHVWYCFNNDIRCCKGYHTFPYCSFGSCNFSICPPDSENKTVLTGGTYGCHFNNGLLQCIQEGNIINSAEEEANRPWSCYINGSICGNNCDILNPTSCGTCNNFKCWDNSVFDSSQNMCCKDNVCCNSYGDCYINNILCAKGCPAQHFATYCEVGECYNNCPTGWSFILNSTFGGGACLSADKKKECIFVTTYGGYECLYEGRSCGRGCSSDGTNCQMSFLQACTSSKECVYGVKEEETIYGEPCICASGIEGIDSNGNRWCCAPGHTFTNGGCTLIKCPEGQTPDENGICKTACENNAEVLNCVCDGTIYTNVFNAKICCESGYSWNENTQTCQ